MTLPNDFWGLIGNIMVTTSAVALLTFMVLYTIWVRWERSWGGRFIMRSSLALFLVALLAVFYLVFKWWYDWIVVFRAVVFFFILVTVADRIIFMVKIRVQARREARAILNRVREMK